MCSKILTKGRIACRAFGGEALKMQDVKMEYAKLKNDGETFSKLRTENSRGLENAGLKNNGQQF